MARKKTSKDLSSNKLFVLAVLVIGLIATVFLTLYGTGILTFAQGFPAAQARNVLTKDTPRSCRQMFNKLRASFNTQCGQRRYNSVADMNKDKQVDLQDFSLLAVNVQSDQWCQGMLDDKTDPCSFPEMPPVCAQIKDNIAAAFNSQCGDENYNAKADINGDGMVSLKDFSELALNYQVQGWCDRVVASSLNVCSLPELSSECSQLFTKISFGFNKQCGELGYDGAADINNDKSVSLKDFSTFALNYKTAGWCQKELSSRVNSCN